MSRLTYEHIISNEYDDEKEQKVLLGNPEELEYLSNLLDVEENELNYSDYYKIIIEGDTQ